ncbi:zinc finger protein 660-like isoform X2 [Acipenser ruthenus]|uniref:zinc finger protein 660-like isoform X2 n=1 Tax=Acipenser ruthenus TaxID=7906 RepID=UPI002740C402|nr:zinc finger protein 660-like isoform X2 [Acipenser ruthenus]
MDVSVSVSFFQDELASTIEHAVKAAVDTVLCQITKVVGGKFTEFQMEMAGKEKENESLKLRLEISESELKAVRLCVSAADANIRQGLGNMNTDCKEQNHPRIESQRLFTRVKDSGESPAFSEAGEGPVIEAVYTKEEICDQEWCGRIMEITELTSAESKDVPELEPVHIKEGAAELECDHITEEVSKENKVNTLEENIVKMESSHCEDYPPEQICMKPNQPVSEDTGSSVGEEGTVLWSIQRKHHPPQERAADGKEEGAMPSTSSTAYLGRRTSTPAPQSKISSDGKLHRKQKHRESTPQDEYVKKLRTRSVQNLSARHSRPLPVGYTATPHPDSSATQGNFISLQTPQQIPSEQILYHCSECGTNFSDRGKLKIHQRIHTGKKPNHCTECGKTFRFATGLKLHQRIHTGDKSYVCPDCGRSFNQKSNLQAHQRIHTGEKPYVCPVCGRGFNRKDSLRIHHNTHTRDKPFHCADCGKGFNRKDRLQAHQRIHTGEKPYVCPLCGRSFNWKDSLRIHHNTHTRDKPFYCADCGKGFNRKDRLQAHQRIHTALKMFNCADCGKSFNQKCNLEKHQLTHTGLKPYVSPVCGKSFSRRHSLRTHHIIHTGEKPFDYSDCGKRFVESKKLKKHRLVHRAVVR